MINLLVDVSQNLAATIDEIRAVPADAMRYNAAPEGEPPRVVIDYIVGDGTDIPPGCVYAVQWDGSGEPVELVPLADGIVRRHTFGGW